MAKNLFVADADYERAQAFKRKYGCTLQHAVRTFIRGWDMLTEDQQLKALTGAAESKPRRRKPRSRPRPEPVAA